MAMKIRDVENAEKKQALIQHSSSRISHLPLYTTHMRQGKHNIPPPHHFDNILTGWNFHRKKPKRYCLSVLGKVQIDQIVSNHSHQCTSYNTHQLYGHYNPQLTETEIEESDWMLLHTRLSKMMKYILVTMPLVAQMSHRTMKTKVFFIYEHNHREASRNLTLGHGRN